MEKMINETEKERFEAPKAEIIVFSTEDVITTSGGEEDGVWHDEGWE